MGKNVSGNEGKSNAERILSDHNLFIIWQPEYNLGIPIIDEQHRGIVTTVNSLYFGIQHNYVDDIFTPIINMVYDYTRIHFQIEEAFWDKLGCPDVNKHQELHRALMLKLANAGKASVLNHNPKEFMEFLKKWWIDHICNEDRIMRDHVLASAEPKARQLL